MTHRTTCMFLLFSRRSDKHSHTARHYRHTISYTGHLYQCHRGRDPGEIEELPGVISFVPRWAKGWCFICFVFM